jgi:hypothetical protein
MAVMPAQVRAIAPEFRDSGKYPDADLQAAIDDATLEINPVAWGTMSDVGTKWLAAHKFAVAHPEASQTGGPVRLYETPGASDAGQLGTTRFGMEYTRLRRTIGVRGLVP